MLEELLKKKSVLVADGAMGTTLFELGLESGEAPERLNIEQPEMIARVHRGFVEAGADLILTNTFGGNRRRLAMHGLGDRVTEFNRAGVEIARRVAAQAPGQVLVAASVGPTGDLLEPLGPLSYAEGVEVFAQQMEPLSDAGADLLWIETMFSWDEVRAATEAARSLGAPHAVTMSFDTKGHTMMGIRPSDLGEWWAGLSQESRPVAVGANCGTGLDEALTAAGAIHQAAPGAPVVVKSNCGIPVFRDARPIYPEGPERMADYTRQAVRAGCTIIGTCCGSTPRHTQAIRSALADQ